MSSYKSTWDNSDGSLPASTSAQQAELWALVEACQMAEWRTANIYTDSRYAFEVAHNFADNLEARGNAIADQVAWEAPSLLPVLTTRCTSLQAWDSDIGRDLKEIQDNCSRVEKWTNWGYLKCAPMAYGDMKRLDSQLLHNALFGSLLGPSGLDTNGNPVPKKLVELWVLKICPTSLWLAKRLTQDQIRPCLIMSSCLGRTFPA